MNLPEFITYCKLSGLIRRSYNINDGSYKVLIDKEDVHAQILYHTIGSGGIIKCYLAVGENDWRETTTLSVIVEAFFPDELR